MPVNALFDLHGRYGLGIHPDGNVPGTEGCIGLLDSDTSDFRGMLDGYIMQNGCIDLKVE